MYWIGLMIPSVWGLSRDLCPVAGLYARMQHAQNKRKEVAVSMLLKLPAWRHQKKHLNPISGHFGMPESYNCAEPGRAGCFHIPRSDSDSVPGPGAPAAGIGRMDPTVAVPVHFGGGPRGLVRAPSSTILCSRLTWMAGTLDQYTHTKDRSRT